MTTLAVVPYEADTRTPVAVSFVSHAIDVYFDFSKGTSLGVPLGTAYCIPDLPPIDNEEDDSARNKGINDFHQDAHGRNEPALECELINSVLRYCSQPGWTNFDLIASFPPLEKPPIFSTPKPISKSNPFFSFLSPETSSPHLLIPVYAVIDLCVSYIRVNHTC